VLNREINKYIDKHTVVVKPHRTKSTGKTLWTSGQAEIYEWEGN